MAITSGLFNSINGDRRYDAKWFARYFSRFIGNGVFPNPSTGLQVTENVNMRTVVKAGDGWINGYFIVNDSDYVLQHDVADGVLKRIDRVVMRLNYLSRQIEITIKKGSPASTPSAPLLQRDADMHELAIADVFINNGATVISQASITDTRLNKALCGIVHGTVDQVDTTTIFNQYQSWFGDFTDEKQVEFEAWLDDLKDILDGDVAANLANRIASLEGAVTTLDNKVTTHMADLAYQKAGGTATALTVNMQPLSDGYAKTFIAFANNNSAATTINGKLLYKPNTTAAPTLIAGKAYTVWYSQTSDCFFIKASAEGTATTAQVLAGVPFSNEVDTGLIGTMPNLGAITTNITAQGQAYTIPQGYHDGTGKVIGTYQAGVRFQSGSVSIPHGAAVTVSPGFNASMVNADIDGSYWAFNYNGYMATLGGSNTVQVLSVGSNPQLRNGYGIQQNVRWRAWA